MADRPDRGELDRRPAGLSGSRVIATETGFGDAIAAYALPR